MSPIEKLCRDTLESVWPQPPMTDHELLAELGFTPDQQELVTRFTDKQELTVRHMLRMAVWHYMSQYEDEPPTPPANFENIAPSFAPPESLFRPEGER